MFKEAAIPVKYLQGYLEPTYAKTILLSYRRHCCSAGRQCLSSQMFTLLQSLKCSKWLAGTSQSSWSPLSREQQLLPLTAEPPAHLLPASKSISLQGLHLLFAINIQRQEDFQIFLCFKILMHSLAFNFLFITKNPLNLAF